MAHKTSSGLSKTRVKKGLPEKFYAFLRRRTRRFERRRLATAIGRSDPLRIIIGADRTRYKGWISTNIGSLNLLREEDWAEFFNRRGIDAILAEHVWHYLSPEEAVMAAGTCRRYLKPGGYLRLAVPDGFFPDPGYIEWVKPGGCGGTAKSHKEIYNYRMLKDLFEAAGFRVRPLEYFDENGTFHFEDWNPEDGFIKRSKRFDPRNADGVLRYTSLVCDAHKIGNSFLFFK